MKKRFFIALILLLTLISYFPIQYSTYIWDDDNYVTENKTLQSLSGLSDIWLKPTSTPQYYPLVHTTFWIEHQLWGLHPLGYHLTNVFLHSGAAILVGILLTRIAVPGAWFAALVFAIHPVNVESVAWITERKNVLSGVFYFASLCFFFPKKANARLQKRRVVFAFIFYVFALLSKTVTCSLPAIILLIWWYKGCTFSGLLRKGLTYLIPFFSVGMMLGLFTVYLETNHVGASGKEWDIPFIGRWIIAGKALWFYMGKLLFPVNLVFIYPRWNIIPSYWPDYLFFLGFLGILLVLYVIRDKIGRGACTAGSMFAITLIPAIGFFDVYPMRYSFVADHFQYLASIPILTLVTGSITLASKKFSPLLRNTAYFRFIGSAIIVLIIGSLSLLSWQRCYAFKDVEHLWKDTLKKNPDAWIAHNNLGLFFKKKRDFPQAIYHYTQALVIRPSHAGAYNNLGMIWELSREYEKAKRCFYRALFLESNNSQIQVNFGNFLARRKEYTKAKIIYEKALKNNPRSPDILMNLGTLHLEDKKYHKAVFWYTKMLDYHPKNARAHLYLANTFLFLNKKKDAVYHYNLAVRYQPQYKEQVQVRLEEFYENRRSSTNPMR